MGFSFLRNTRWVFKTDKTDHHFVTCDSIRALGIAYATLGYTYLLGIVVNETFSTGIIPYSQVTFVTITAP